MKGQVWLDELVHNSFGGIGTFFEVWLFFLSSVEIEAVPKVFFVVFGRLGVGDGGVIVICAVVIHIDTRSSRI